MFLFGDRTRPSAGPSRVFTFSKTLPGPRSGQPGATAAEHCCCERTSWAASPAKDEWPRLRAARLSVSGARPTALRRDFSLLSRFFFPR
ncbi:hypothetical protein REMIM1_PE00101 (plasmid) [Rhizobium etli bv. mimosae str. Mim1]|nr:hypothetical protein REMIM1_PE00101 [Rhizobium etli bv. mimosae str. Mim1]